MIGRCQAGMWCMWCVQVVNSSERLLLIPFSVVAKMAMMLIRVTSFCFWFASCLFMDVGPLLFLLCSWANLNVPIVHPQTQLMDHICLHLCQRVGVTALLVRLWRALMVNMMVIYPQQRQETGRGSPANSLRKWSMRKVWVFCGSASARYWVCYSSCQWGAHGARKEGAVGASDLPRAAVWVGTAARASGGTWKGSGHHFSFSYIKLFFPLFLFQYSSLIFFIFAHFTTFQPSLHPWSSRPAMMGSGA